MLVCIKLTVMRTRENVEPARDGYLTESWFYTKKSTGAITQRSSPKRAIAIVPSFRRDSEISSDLLEKSTFKQWNSFEHYKSHVSLASFYARAKSWKFIASNSWYDTFEMDHPFWMYNISSFGPPDNPTSGLPGVYDTSTPGHFVTLGDLNIANLNATALRAMLPGIRPSMSLLNSFYELKDFRRLPDTLRRIWKLKSFITQIATNAGMKGRDAYSRWLGRKTLRRALNSTADGYLTNQFAILPLLSDILGFQKALTGVDAQVVKLLALEGKRCVRHYNATCPLGAAFAAKSETSSLYTDTSVNQSLIYGRHKEPGIIGTRPYCATSCQMVRHVRAATAKFHAEVEYWYYFTQYQRERASVLALMDALGVNVNLAILWNAIPWTFVVDWVINLSKWLDQFKIQNMEPLTIIGRYLYSVSIDRRIEVGITYDIDPYLSAAYKPVVYFDEHGYRREVVPAPLQEAINAEVTNISLKEFSLAGSILLAKRTR